MEMKPIRKQDTTIIWSEEDNAFLASCGKFISHGNSRQEALRFLEEAIEFSITIIGTSSPFTTDIPTKEGDYWMKCMENDQTQEPVSIYWLQTDNHGRILACDWELGNGYPVKRVHNGLTDISWSQATPGSNA